MSDRYLRFWGVRGSYAAPHESHLGVGGNTSCVEIRCDDHLLVCDGGTGIISLGEELMAQSALSELMVVFTHERPRRTPDSPMSRISRSTVQRATTIPSRPSCRQTLSAP